MKKLNNFLKFDVDKFLNDKKLKFLGVSEWKDFESKEVLGSKYTVVIVEDKTDYNCKDGEMVTNLYEKLQLKCKKNINIPMGAIVKPINAVGVVWGDFRNNLSICCDDIIVADANSNGNGIVKKSGGVT